MDMSIYIYSIHILFYHILLQDDGYHRWFLHRSRQGAAAPSRLQWGTWDPSDGPEWSDHGIPWENPWRIWEVPPGTKKRLGETQLDSMIWSFWLYGCVWTWGITMDYCSCVLWPFNEAWTIMDSYGFCVQNLWSLGIPFWWNFRHIYQICRLQILATASKPNFPRSWRFFPWPGAAHLIHDVPPVAVPCNYGPWWLKRWEFWECNIMVFAKDFLQAVSIHIVI